MNAKKISLVRIGLTMTALALSGLLAFSISCAGNGNGGGGTGGGGSGGGGGGTGGGGGAGGAGGGGGVAGGGGGDYCNEDPPADTVGFCKGSAKGVFKGVGFVSLGIKDKLTEPTCDGTEITKEAPCNTATTWNADGKLCMTGTIPKLPKPAVQQDYKDNWGVQIGVNTTEPPADKGGETLNQDYTNVVFNVSGKPETGLRFFVHLKGDIEDLTYCVNSKSGQKTSLDGFNTKCWGEAGTVNLTFDKVKDIDKAGVQVSSTDSAEIAVENLCLESIVFGK
jgi:hypothetical protein